MIATRLFAAVPPVEQALAAYLFEARVAVN